MKKIYIKLLVIILPLLVITPLTFSNKEVKKEKEIAIKEPSLPGGIVAYTLGGEKTNISYNELINSYAVNKITCKNGTNATFNTYDKSISFSNVQIPDYCTIDFNYTFLSKLLSDNPTISERTDFTTIFSETKTGTLYKATESIVGSEAKDVYYFAGNITNNWVKFAGYYWRIIRTNYDSSIRLLYHGTSPSATDSYIGTTVYNSTYSNSMYAGYMYGTSGTLASNRTNTNNSTVKGIIDNWYSTNLSSYSKYFSQNAVYCVDREIGSGTYAATGSTFYYAANSRIITNYKPTYNCTNNKDAFSGSNSEAKLTYPIGLMTADEVAYAGGRGNLSNSSVWYYLNNSGGSSVGSNWWWLISPCGFNSYSAGVFVTDGYGSTPGYLGNTSVDQTASGGKIRPVISLKGNLIWKSGDGSSSSPYEVEDLPPTTLYDEILADNPNISTNTDFSTVITDINTGTLYKETESIAGSEAKDVYYFAGRAQNNWVKFGDIYWRIIRTNHDGSVRLLYAGKTLTSSSLECIDVGNYNTNYTNSMYVGYMYGPSGSLESNRTNTNNSTIKNFLDTWYTNNLNNYTNYISKDAVYCNDRDIGSGTYVTIGTSFKFAPYTRVINNKKPSYNCNNTKDAFSGNNSEAKLTYPISLMTLDEIMFAGGNSYTTRHNAWYMLNSSNSSYGVSGSFWLLSPAEGPGSFASVFVIDRTTGSIGTSNVENNLGIRPVISIKSDALWSSGNGSPTNPYEIIYN